MHKVGFFTQLTNAVLWRVGKILDLSRDVYYLYKNRRKAKVLIFTDSRGYEVTKAWNRKSAYASYVGEFVKFYHVEYVICPEFSTTIIDFLYEYQKRTAIGKKYDAIIAHVGVVDFSPRPTSMLKDMMVNKRDKLAKLFEEETITCLENYSAQPFDQLYFGKTVKNFYSMEFLDEHVIPNLKAIDNLILIGCNPILHNWRGNYWRDRPHNMNMVLDYSNRCKSELEYFIDLSKLSENEIKTLTIDNIHLSRDGFRYLHQLINAKLSVILAKGEGL